MKRKQLFIGGICIAFASLVAVSAVVALGLEGKRDVFIFWEFVGNFCRGILLVSAIWVLVVAILRWKGLSSALRFAGLSPVICIVGMVAVSFALDHARPNVSLFVSYKGSQDEMHIDVTTHYGSIGETYKPGEEKLACRDRGFPNILHVEWGTNYTTPFSKAFDMKGKIPRFGNNETLRVIVSDQGAKLEINGEAGGAANAAPPHR